MRIPVFLVFLMVGIPVLVAQESKPLRIIEWSSPIVLSGKNVKPVLAFKGAVYNDFHTGLPKFSELIKMSVGCSQGEISLVNCVFEPLDSLERIIAGALKFDTLIKVDNEIGTSREENFIRLSFIPLRSNPMNGRPEKLKQFEIKLTGSPTVKSGFLKSQSYAAHSVLSSGKWLKVKVDNTGIYKLTYNQLKSFGFVNPRNIRIYGNGGTMLPISNSVPRIDDLAEIPVRFVETTEGVFVSGDFVLFYIRGVTNWTYNSADQFYYHQQNKFSDFTYCFITESLGPADEIPVQGSSILASDHDISNYDDYSSHEMDIYNLIKSGSEWYGELFDVNNVYDFQFNFSDLSLADSVKLYIKLVGRYNDNTSFSINLNEQPLPSVTIAGVPIYSETDDYASIGTMKAATRVNSENLDLRIKYNNDGLEAAQGWLDFIDINVRRALKMNNDLLQFRESNLTGSGRVGRYIINNVLSGTKVWDVTDMHHPFEIELIMNGQNAQFRAPTDSLHEYVAFNPQGNYPSPTADGQDAGWLANNQDLHASEGADLVIVTHPDFLVQAQQLSQLHTEQDNMKVIVAATNEVYNEFSSGMTDVSAIRDFMKMIYDRGRITGHLPSYLLLVGDGSYDNKSDLKATKNANFIPTFESPNSLGQSESFVTDDFFGLLDDNEGGYGGLLDIGVGRLPVQDTAQAGAIVQKIRMYTDPANRKDW
jgi:hypothetical protein